jgi:predicted ArsR family transcriptional regulator
MATPTGRRQAILAILQNATTPLEITTIAEQLQVHPNTVRFHLEALTGTGQVERVSPPGPSGPGRPPLMFQAHRGMNPQGPRNYQLLAGILADSLAEAADPVAAATETGRHWGAQIDTATPATGSLSAEQAIDRLVGLLDELGFAAQVQPDTEPDAGQIGLRHCPFLDLVQTRAEVICPLHLGLMQGAMATLPTTVTVERLVPFARPDLCLVQLGSRTGVA